MISLVYLPIGIVVIVAMELPIRAALGVVDAMARYWWRLLGALCSYVVQSAHQSLLVYSRVSSCDIALSLSLSLSLSLLCWMIQVPCRKIFRASHSLGQRKLSTNWTAPQSMVASLSRSLAQASTRASSKCDWRTSSHCPRLGTLLNSQTLFEESFQRLLDDLEAQAKATGQRPRIPLQSLTIENYIDCYVLVASRAWGVSGSASNDREIMLIPIADMLNHNDSAVCVTRIAHSRSLARSCESKLIRSMRHVCGRKVFGRNSACRLRGHVQRSRQQGLGGLYELRCQECRWASTLVWLRASTTREPGICRYPLGSWCT